MGREQDMVDMVLHKVLDSKVLDSKVLDSMVLDSKDRRSSCRSLKA